MTEIKITTNIGSTFYSNAGSAMQMNYDAQMTGKVRRHDNVPFDRGSDIPELLASVKSSHFTLASGTALRGETMTDQWSDYAGRVHSKKFVYVTLTGLAYEMNLEEFKKFVFTWCRMERDSAKNGGAVKIRCKRESKKMTKWLQEQVA